MVYYFDNDKRFRTALENNAVSIINPGFLIGWGIDAATGSLMKYDRKGYDIGLEKDDRTSLLNNPAEIEINTTEQLVDVYVTQK